MTTEVKAGGIAALSAVASDAVLAKMREDFASLSADTKEGYEEVRQAIKLCVKTRTGIDAARKNLNAEALKWQRDVNAEAKRITSEVEAIEEPLVKMKEAVDAEAERKRKELEAKQLAFVNGRMAQYLAVAGEVCPLETAEALPEIEWAEYLRVGGEKHEERKAAAAAAADAERLVREKIEADLQAARAEAQALREQSEKERAELDALRAEKRAAEARAAEEAAAAIRLEEDRRTAEMRAVSEANLNATLSRIRAKKPSYVRDLDSALHSLGRFADGDATFLYGHSIEEAKRALMQLFKEFDASMNSAGFVCAD